MVKIVPVFFYSKIGGRSLKLIVNVTSKVKRHSKQAILMMTLWKNVG
jgi:hypothetical protein